MSETTEELTLGSKIGGTIVWIVILFIPYWYWHCSGGVRGLKNIHVYEIFHDDVLAAMNAKTAAQTMSKTMLANMGYDVDMTFGIMNGAAAAGLSQGQRCDYALENLCESYQVIGLTGEPYCKALQEKSRPSAPYTGTAAKKPQPAKAQQPKMVTEERCSEDSSHCWNQRHKDR